MIIAFKAGLTVTVSKQFIIFQGLDERNNPILLWLTHSDLAVINRCVEDSLKEKD